MVVVISRNDVLYPSRTSLLVTRELEASQQRNDNDDEKLLISKSQILESKKSVFGAH